MIKEDKGVDVYLYSRTNGRLGSGHFGSIEQGLWRNGADSVHIAVKHLIEGANEINRVNLLQEAAIMAQFTHPNVVSLYGVVSNTESVRLVASIKSLIAIHQIP